MHVEWLVALDVFVSAHVGLLAGALVVVVSPETGARMIRDARAMIADARAVLRPPTA